MTETKMKETILKRCDHLAARILRADNGHSSYDRQELGALFKALEVLALIPKRDLGKTSKPKTLRCKICKSSKLELIEEVFNEQTSGEKASKEDARKARDESNLRYVQSLISKSA